MSSHFSEYAESRLTLVNRRSGVAYACVSYALNGPSIDQIFTADREGVPTIAAARTRLHTDDITNFLGSSKTLSHSNLINHHPAGKRTVPQLLFNGDNLA